MAERTLVLNREITGGIGLARKMEITHRRDRCRGAPACAPRVWLVRRGGRADTRVRPYLQSVSPVYSGVEQNPSTAAYD